MTEYFGIPFDRERDRLLYDTVDCKFKGKPFHLTETERLIECNHEESREELKCVMGYKSMGEFVDLEGTPRTPCPVSGLIPITRLERYRE